MDGRNECYTYFRMTGTFEPDTISELLDLRPDEQWRIGDKIKNGTEYEFASWLFGTCDQYNFCVEKQMMCTIQPLLSKVEQLKAIKENYEVYYTLEIVPTIYVGDRPPCLAPSKEVIKFCCETDTKMDIDLYLCDADDNG